MIGCLGRRFYIDLSMPIKTFAIGTKDFQNVLVSKNFSKNSLLILTRRMPTLYSPWIFIFDAWFGDLPKRKRQIRFFLRFFFLKILKNDYKKVYRRWAITIAYQAKDKLLNNFRSNLGLNDAFYLKAKIEQNHWFWF